MKFPIRSFFSLTLLSLAFGLLAHPTVAQTIISEAESTSSSNDTFATAEDCRFIGNSFTIKGRVLAPPGGNTNSDDEWYMFEGQGGACVNVDMNITVPMGTGATYQLNTWLFDSTQTMIAAWNTTSASSSASFGIGSFTLPTTGTYYIYVTEWSVAPNALAQPGISFTPLSNQGFAVIGATPDSTRNTAGGNQSGGSLYELSVSVSSGNEANFNALIDCDPITGAITCSPDPVRVCWQAGGSNTVTFRATNTCPAGLTIDIGGGAGPIAPGGTAVLSAVGPEISSTILVDDGTGPQPCGTVETVTSLFTRNGEAISAVDICAGSSVCLSVCSAPGTTYIAALSETCGVPLNIGFLSKFELDLNGFLFAATFPNNTLMPIATGFAGIPGSDQVCLNLPNGSVPTPFTVYVQAVTLSATGLSGVTQKVALNARP